MFKKLFEEVVTAGKKMLEPTIENIHYVEVAPRLFITALASKQDETVLSKHLRKAHPGRFFVYNLSAHRVRRVRPPPPSAGNGAATSGSSASGSSGSRSGSSNTAAGHTKGPGPDHQSSSNEGGARGGAATSAAPAKTSFSLGGDDDDGPGAGEGDGVAGDGDGDGHGDGAATEKNESVAGAASSVSAATDPVDVEARQQAVASGSLPQETEQSLDPSNFDDQVLEFSLPHHAAPFELLLDLGLAVSSWLRADPQHVAVIHSLSAGRAAMAAAVCSLFCGFHETGVEALTAVGRTHPRYLHCTNPGQRRYARYAQDALHLGAVPNRSPLAITRVEITVPRGTPQDSTVIVHVLRGRQILFSSEWPGVTAATGPRGSLVRTFSGFRAGVALDFTLRAYELPVGVPASRRRPLLRFMGHTGFLASGLVRVGADELDDAPAGAELGIEFEEIDGMAESIERDGLAGNEAGDQGNAPVELDPVAAAYLLGEAEAGAERVERKVGEQRRRGEAEELKEKEERARAEAIVARAKAKEAERRRARQEAAAAAAIAFAASSNAAAATTAAVVTADASSPGDQSGATDGGARPPAMSNGDDDQLVMSFEAPSTGAKAAAVAAGHRASNQASDPCQALGAELFATRVVAPFLSHTDAGRCLLVCTKWRDALAGPVTTSAGGTGDTFPLWSRIASNLCRSSPFPPTAQQESDDTATLAAFTGNVMAPIVAARSHAGSWARRVMPGEGGGAMPAAVTCVAISADGTVIAGCEDGTVRCWWSSSSSSSSASSCASVEASESTTTNARPGQWSHGERVTAVCAARGSTTGAYAASGCEGGVVQIAGGIGARQGDDGESGDGGEASASSAPQALRRLEGHIAEVTAVVPCHGGERLATAGSDYLLNVWSVAEGTVLWSVQEPVSVTAPPFLGLWCPRDVAGPRGAIEAVVYGDDECPSIKTYATASGDVLSTDPVPPPASDDLDAVSLSGVSGEKVQLGRGGVVTAADDGCIRVSREMARFGEITSERLECFHLHAGSGDIYAADRAGAVSVTPAADVFGQMDTETEQLQGPTDGDAGAGITAFRVHPFGHAAVAAFRDDNHTVAWFSFVSTP